ncbi:trypsin-like serine protease [Stenotrophobium rhamnosiphilum]|uniref:Peptidase S1 domain-containing protein n=1 Tax=Stenotrophobium rhamnosiphilum TaxID=2029166 RepID=A0A2T5MCM6_9GAMM|nr:trypsin-like serine protease [Stenotrophobium rhamnosiphilum]PTU30315.1 hypothetical protein CJD38_15325 [Stenotrophobium rhamnosiphilum]
MRLKRNLFLGVIALYFLTAHAQETGGMGQGAAFKLPSKQLGDPRFTTYGYGDIDSLLHEYKLVLKDQDTHSHKVPGVKVGGTFVPSNEYGKPFKLELYSPSLYDQLAKQALDDAVQSCVDSMDEIPYSLADSPGPPDPTTRDDVTKFVNACMSKDEQYPKVDHVVAEQATVALVYQGSVLCMGLLINDKRLVTSRHCFVSRDEGKLTALATKPKDWRGYTLDGHRQITFEGFEKLETKSEFDISQDAITVPVVVTTVGSSVSPLPRVTHQEPKAKMSFWLAGPIPYLAKIASQPTATTKYDSSQIHWRDGIRYQKWLGGSCSISEIQKDCVFHQCQSFFGFSGSPMIVSARTQGDQSEIVWVGVHSGAPGTGAEGWSSCSYVHASSDSLDGNVASLWRAQ